MTASSDGPEQAGPQRDELEARWTHRRLVELHLNPVQGEFDAEHLKEINRRIFQDLPGEGFDDVTPGEYRLPVEGQNDWVKTRRLESVGITTTVAYSSMDGTAQEQLERELANARPEQLARLDTGAAARVLATLYVSLDYIHPFPDGNSRTLREFTRELADAAGYSLEWERVAQSSTGRDELYVARDLSVNDLALPKIKNDGTRRAVQLTLDQLAGNRRLPEILEGVLKKPGKPSRPGS